MKNNCTPPQNHTDMKPENQFLIEIRKRMRNKEKKLNKINELQLKSDKKQIELNQD